MCKLGKTLKLCTCSDKIDKKKPYWTLARKTIKQYEQTYEINGHWELSHTDDDDTLLKINNWLLEQLNNEQCFDFKYEPLDEDKLIINKDGLKHEFLYSSECNSWCEFGEENPFKFPTKRSVAVKGYVKYLS